FEHCLCLRGSGKLTLRKCACAKCKAGAGKRTNEKLAKHGSLRCSRPRSRQREGTGRPIGNEVVVGPTLFSRGQLTAELSVPRYLGKQGACLATANVVTAPRRLSFLLAPRCRHRRSSNVRQ